MEIIPKQILTVKSSRKVTLPTGEEITLITLEDGREIVDEEEIKNVFGLTIQEFSLGIRIIESMYCRGKNR